MLTASKPSIWTQGYAMDLDGAALTTLRFSAWSGRSGFACEGRQWSIRHRGLGSRYELSCEPGGVVALAEKAGRKYWSITGYGQRFEFERASMWRAEYRLMAAGRPVGSLRRLSVWRGGAVAELPGMPVPLQIFALGVMLTIWRNNAAAASS